MRINTEVILRIGNVDVWAKFVRNTTFPIVPSVGHEIDSGVEGFRLLLIARVNWALGNHARLVVVLRPLDNIDISDAGGIGKVIELFRRDEWLVEESHGLG